jgi:hypothetical protein
MVRVRITYKKVGAIRYASHRDLMRIFRRGFTAGGVPVCYSQGFNPHPRLSFGPSLRTGWEGYGECMDVELERHAPDLVARSNANLPDGLEILEAVELTGSTPKLSADIGAARYEVIVDPATLQPGRNASWDRFVTTVADTTSAPAGTPALDERVLSALASDINTRYGPGDDTGEPHDEPRLLDVKLSSTKDGDLCLEYLSTMHQGKSIFPEQILEPVMGAALEQDVPWSVVRTGLYVRRHGACHSPTDKGAVQ